MTSVVVIYNCFLKSSFFFRHKPSEFFNEKTTQDLIIELLFLYVKFTNSEYRQVEDFVY